MHDSGIGERERERESVCTYNPVTQTHLSPSSSRMIEIQEQMAYRAIELLALPEDTPSYILDVG